MTFTAPSVGGSTTSANSGAPFGTTVTAKPAFGGNASFSSGPALGFGTTPAKGIFGVTGMLDK